jgi:hypothetical protein
MRFWNRLRLIATAMFLALLCLGWLAADRNPAPPPGAKSPLRSAPDFHR